MVGSDTVSALQQWLASPRGQFFHARQRRLLERMLAAWPRRGRSLLEIGCGPGHLLDVFWQSGFDVTGTDHSPAMLAAARERLGHRVDLHLAAYDHLPFADREFDYVALTGCPPTREHLAEAVRLASRGVLVTFCNRLSLAGAASLLRRPNSFPPPRQTACFWPVQRRLRALARAQAFPNARNSRLAQRSTLLGPPLSWVDHMPWSLLNDWVCLLPVGAWHVIRLDLAPTVGMTPLVQLAKGKLAPSLRTSSCASFSDKAPCLNDKTPRF
ncbi:class I SAM-dependent methyltransferase [Megalodesulfovibrio gigas]|uniref:Putative methyltransferase type 11 n=1 Tax=Megalodesulfovibrio gigas (strain ATCC 19364 / DSM 1382 / NCIMB 9332 / VKM B-1759) TaxID=1121448 RepID=T2G832_MEGG1|nr:class I SAM-dependent methyltransferase [Megalodesulfovibrio gigas]AGW12740.1 putative methyltransferase type 11 [Megalodesulfovibrio gigas DSM 1382 = ATCC 19364]